jgi:hypothetical protein
MHTIQQLPAAGKGEIILGITFDAGAKGRGEYHNVHILKPLADSTEHRLRCDRCGEKCNGVSLARALLQRDMIPMLQGTKQAQTSNIARSLARIGSRVAD